MDIYFLFFGDKLPTRYDIIVIHPVTAAYDRMWDKNGDEVDYQWNLGRKGTKNYHEPTVLSQNDLVKRLGGEGATEPVNPELLESHLRKHLHPHQQNVFEFWVDHNLAGAKEL